MKLYKSTPLFDRYTGKNTGETERICNGRICDYCGVELDNDFNDENFPNVMYEIHDVGNYEPYYHEDRIKFTVEEALELFDVDWDQDIQVDNYELFHDDHFMYCQERDCLQIILRNALSRDAEGGGLWLENSMATARLKYGRTCFKNKDFHS